MNDIIYMGLPPSHHYFSMDHGDSLNSFLFKRLNSFEGSEDLSDANFELNPMKLFTEQELKTVPGDSFSNKIRHKYEFF